MATIDRSSKPKMRVQVLLHLSPSLSLTLASLFWAGNFVAGRALGGEIDPVALNTLRWGIAFALAAPWMIPSLWRHRRIVGREWRYLASLGVTGVAGFHTIVYHALGTTTAVNALLMVALAPGAIIIAASVLDRRVPARREAIAAAAALSGASLVLSQGRIDAISILAPGDGWMVLAVALWTTYSLLLRRRPAGLTPAATLAGSIAFGLATLGPLLIGNALVNDRLAILPANPEAWGAVIYLSLFASLAAFACWSRGVEALGPARASVYLHLMPLFGTLLAVALLGESLAPIQAVGGAIVLGALAWGARPRSQPN